MRLQTPLQAMAELLQRLMSMWADFQQNEIDEAIVQWRNMPVFVHKVISNRYFGMILCTNTAILDDCIKCVLSVTFLTSSYCCKLLK